MKQILCFGDSNTWGYDGESRERLGNTCPGGSDHADAGN